MEKENYTLQEIMGLLGVSRQMIWKYQQKDLISIVMAGGKRFYLNDEKLQSLLKKRVNVIAPPDHENRIQKLEQKVEELTKSLTALQETNQLLVNKLTNTTSTKQSFTKNGLPNFVNTESTAPPKKVNKETNSLPTAVKQPSTGFTTKVNLASTDLPNQVNSTSTNLPEMRNVIEKAIESGISKRKIDPSSKGTQLGKWIKGTANPRENKILDWYQNVIKLT